MNYRTNTQLPEIIHAWPALNRLLSVAALCLLTAGAAHALTVPDQAALLGNTLEQLRPMLGDALAVKAPRRLSSGARGTLRMPDVECEGLHFEQTLYFANQKLEQLELVTPAGRAVAGDLPHNMSPQAALLAALRARLGPELAAFGAAPDALVDSASWVYGNADVLMSRAGPADQPVLRLVIRVRHVVDAAEL